MLGCFLFLAWECTGLLDLRWRLSRSERLSTVKTGSVYCSYTACEFVCCSLENSERTRAPPAEYLHDNGAQI